MRPRPSIAGRCSDATNAQRRTESTEARIERIRREVANGSYRVDAEELSRRIVEDALTNQSKAPHTDWD